MKNLPLILLLIAATILASCKPKEEPTPDKEAVTVTMDASIHLPIAPAGNGPMRVHLGTDNTADHSLYTQLLWSEGDEVICWSSTEKKYAPYHLIAGANTTEGKFKGKAVDARDDKLDQLALYIDCAIYPATAIAPFISENVLTYPGDLTTSTYFVRPSNQTYHAPIDGNPTFDPALNIMTGRGNGSGTTYFQSAGGILLLRIKGSTAIPSLYGLKLVAGDPNEKLWGCFSAAIGVSGAATVEYVGDAPSVANKSGFVGNNTIILDCHESFGSGLPKDAEDNYVFTNFYFVLPYGVLTQGFDILMDTDGNGYNDGTITTRKDNTIMQSDIKVMPALELTENVTLTWDLDDLYQQGTVTEF